ncbi:putative lipoprotein [Gottschalkia acidurici 9a]|uniref:Lipoprotein n=2 Tax=Clostridium acidurici TaxID=1556 RepID=K0AUE2_GOTA9|nr:putative lipoprotein [Gottschalkia acidurici 9a]
MIGGCDSDQLKAELTNSKLSNSILHQTFNYEEATEAEVLSIFNTVGDIKISRSESDKVIVIAQLEQTKELKDIDKKLENLVIQPQIRNGVIYFEPLYNKDTSRNYWEWISSELNGNGININFDIQIPDTIKELRVYNEIGDIELNNISSKIYAQTNIGSIVGTDLNPLDTATFISNIPKLQNEGINISLSSIDNVNSIITATTLNDITINLPKESNYSHIENDDIATEYPYEISTNSNVNYIRKKSLEKLNNLNNKRNNTVITTHVSDDLLREVYINIEGDNKNV